MVFKQNKTISDGGITVDPWFIKVHTSNRSSNNWGSSNSWGSSNTWGLLAAAGIIEYLGIIGFFWIFKVHTFI